MHAHRACPDEKILPESKAPGVQRRPKPNFASSVATSICDTDLRRRRRGWLGVRDALAGAEYDLALARGVSTGAIN
jgi:hypothetical protein